MKLPPLIQRIFLFLLILLTSCLNGCGGYDKFDVIDFSADNKLLYFKRTTASGLVNVGWVNLKTGKPTLITINDSFDKVSTVSPSRDGMYLVANIYQYSGAGYKKSQIGIIDVSKKTYRFVTSDDSTKSSPSFSLDGKKIVYAKAGIVRDAGATRNTKWDLYEMDVHNASERKLTDFCFYQVSRARYFDNDRKIVYSGEGPLCAKDETIESYDRKYEGNDIFVFEREAIFPNKSHPLVPAFTNGKYSSNPTPLEDGSIVFSSRTNEMDGIKGEKYNFDIFVYRGGRIARLTNLKTYLTGLAASNDGSLIAYGSDVDRNGKPTIWLFNVKNNQHENIKFRGSMDFEEFQISLEE